ncbi:1993_t:CDS:2 [Cetraspora pellucida]|uniref:1993_t:CDS:1 n=1 Tax=Cetraspora pellucida TaxID=1433469 RepID=A0A9N9J4G9_9GLOM|nr:1993_t:CDS:2 [Cetraspora pellucida]
MSEIQSSQSSKEYHMNYKIYSHFDPESDIDLALPSDKYVISNLPIIDNTNKTDVFKDGDSENELEDSLLKEIYMDQTFTSFEVLEHCLKRYSIRIGFETKIVRVEKENDICTKLATGNVQPMTIFTDADPAIQVALSNEYPIIADFDHCWMELMNKYPEIQGYCDRVLYPTKECWAYAFTKWKFSANTHSTQQIESINRVIKLEANSENFLCQLQAGIELQLKDEAKYASLQEFRI